MLKIRLGKERLEMIRKGKKVATLREGHRPYHLGQAILSNPEDETDRIEITITNIYHLSFKEVTPELALAQGYTSLEDFVASLKEIYPDLTPDSNVTHVEFKVLAY